MIQEYLRPETFLPVEYVNCTMYIQKKAQAAASDPFCNVHHRAKIAGLGSRIRSRVFLAPWSRKRLKKTGAGAAREKKIRSRSRLKKKVRSRNRSR